MRQDRAGAADQARFPVGRESEVLDEAVEPVERHGREDDAERLACSVGEAIAKCHYGLARDASGDEFA